MADRHRLCEKNGDYSFKLGNEIQRFNPSLTGATQAAKVCHFSATLMT